MILDLGEIYSGPFGSDLFSGPLTRLFASNGEIRGAPIALLVQGERKSNREKFLKLAMQTPL